MERRQFDSPPGLYQDDRAETINVAAVCRSTRSLGPGTRAVLWVQGCAFHCPNCIAPDWIPIRPARMARVDALVTELLGDPSVTGLTFSGGEPMLQAASLARLAWEARKMRSLDIICFSGFTLAHLRRNPPGPGVAELLDQVDVLIDGPYIDKLNDNQGMRGSSNQQVHYLTQRLAGHDFSEKPRRVEIQIQHGEAMLVGVPPQQLKSLVNQAVFLAAGQNGGLAGYERI